MHRRSEDAASRAIRILIAISRAEQDMRDDQPSHPNTLGKTSLFLSIPALSLVFCTGLCAGIGKEQGWLAKAGVLLFVFGATSAFVGLISAFIGLIGVFVRPRATAIVGLVLGMVAVLLFGAVLNAVKQ
jgi:hypothetical protein